MKRKLALLLAMLSICSFASCGDSGKKNDDDNKSSVSRSKDSDDDKNEKDDDDEKDKDEKDNKKDKKGKDDDESSLKSSGEDESSDEDESSKEEDDDDSESSQDEDSDSDEDSKTKDLLGEDYDDAFSDFKFGTIDGSVYTSDFCGLKFEAPEGYVFSTQDEMLKLMNIGAEVLGADKADLYKEIAKQTSVYDMMAKNPKTGDNVILMYENLKAYGASVVSSYGVDEYVEAIESQMEQMQGSGMEYTKKDSDEVEIGGREFKKIVFDCKVESMNYTTTQIYYVSQTGDYMTVIIASAGALGDGDPSIFEDCFSAYEE